MVHQEIMVILHGGAPVKKNVFLTIKNNLENFIVHCLKSMYRATNPVNIYLFKILVETLEKEVKYIQS